MGDKKTAPVMTQDEKDYQAYLKEYQDNLDYQKYLADHAAAQQNQPRGRQVYSAPVGPVPAMERDIYSGELERVKASFAPTEEAKRKELLEKGYADVILGEDGPLVMDKSGQWYKESPSKLRWLESHAGGALPVVGSMAGGFLGSGLASIPASGVGAAAGEMTRQDIGNLLGYRGADPVGVLKEGVIGAAGEVGAKGLAFGGKALLKKAAPYAEPIVSKVSPYVSEAAETIKSGATKAGSRLAAFLTGAPKEAWETYIKNPKAVEGALPATDIAEMARQEVTKRGLTEKEAIKNAREAFRRRFGREAADTEKLISGEGGIREFVEKNAPEVIPKGEVGEGELGRLPQKSIDELNKYEARMTEPEFGPTPRPGAVSSRPSWGGLRGGRPEPETLVPAQRYTPVEPKAVEVGTTQMTPVRLNPSKVVQEGEAVISVPPKSGQGLFSEVKTPYKVKEPGYEPLLGTDKAGMGKTMDIPVMGERLRPSGPEVNIPAVTQTPLAGYESRMPRASFERLQKIADDIGSQIPEWETKYAKSQPADVAYLKQLRHKIKQVMHEKSPDLAKADALYSEYKRNLKLLTGLDKEGAGEAFVKNLFGKNKTLQQEAVQELAPTAFQRAKELAANEAINKGSAAALTARGAAGAVGLHSAYSRDPKEMALASLLFGATSPTLVKLGIKGAQGVLSSPAELAGSAFLRDLTARSIAQGAGRSGSDEK